GQAQPDGRLWRVQTRALRRAVPGFQRRSRGGEVDLGTSDLDAVAFGVVYERLRRIEPYGLRVEQRRAERRRVVQLEPGRCVHQQREAHRMAFGEAEGRE